MDVELYVYDLSKGLARQMSRNFLGVHIDAVYHTALVFGGIEYFFGAGVQTSYAGATHHGRPMEIIPMGRTELPLEIILEYLESLKEIYTVESYDLFMHNCNNFTNDFAMFLLGKGIPDHITSLPQTVLDTPFGQMLKPQLDAAMRGVTQAPVPAPSVPRRNTPLTNGHIPISQPAINGHSFKPSTSTGIVHNVTRLKELEDLLAAAKTSCAVIFFTSATCPPCKIVYPAYDELAAEAGNKAILIKTDLSQSHEIGAKYQVRATPTFITFLQGSKENEWSGANESQLRGNVRMLLQMAHPPHPHTNLRLPTIQRRHHKPITYTQIPPLDKLTTKMGVLAQDPSAQSLTTFLTTRLSSGAAESPLPSLPPITTFILSTLRTCPPSTLFPLVDLIRCIFIDPRISGYYASSPPTLITSILSTVNSLDQCPYPLRIVTLQLACNFFTTPLFPAMLSHPDVAQGLVDLLTSSLLDTTHPPIRMASASLAYNIAASNHERRCDDEPDPVSEDVQVAMMASLLEALQKEEIPDAEARVLVLAVGLLAYKVPREGEVRELCGVMGAKAILERVGGKGEVGKLVREVGEVL